MRREADPEGLPDTRVSANLTPRTVAYRQDGRQRFHYVRPTAFGAALLAAQLADKWVEVCRERPGSSGELASAIRSFLRQFEQQLHQVHCLIELDLGDIRRRHLDSWEQELISDRKYKHKSSPYRKGRFLFALLGRIERDVPGTLHPEVVWRIEQGPRLRYYEGPSLPAFAPNEVRRMRSRAHYLVHQSMQADDSRGPERQALISLAIMISLATGEPIEVLRRLTLDKVLATASSEHDNATQGMTHTERLSYLARHNAVDAFAVTYTKARAGGETHGNVYTRKNREAHRALTALICLTTPIRAESKTTCLWICTRADGSVLEPPWSTRRWSLRHWLLENNISVTEPSTWKRFRKVVVAREAADQGGSYLRRTVRHSPEVFLRDYTSSSVLRNKAGSLLRDTMNDYFEAAVKGPLVVTPEAADLIAQGRQTPDLPGSMGLRLLDGDLNGPHTACRDPLHSPYQEAGAACRLSTTGTCFGCPNALITKDHLPAALLIAEIADPSRSADLREWSKRWEHIHEVLTRIVIPAFPKSTVDAARAKIPAVPLDTGIANDMRGTDEDV